MLGNLLMIAILTLFVINNILEIKKENTKINANKKYISWCRVSAITEFIYIIHLVFTMFLK